MRGSTQQGPARAVRGTAGLAAGALAIAAVVAMAWPVQAASAGSWQVIKTIPGRNVPAVTAVTASGTGLAWAFESSLGKPAAWRLTGSSWATVPFPGRRGDMVTAAGSTSAANAWAFTTLPIGAGRALHWNGTSWAIARQFKRGIGSGLVLGAKDVWIFGEPATKPGGGLGTWQYTGTSWRRFPGLGMLASGSALSAHSIWAVGAKTAAHWNGTRWSTQSLAKVLPPNTQFCRPSVDYVYARSATDVWAAGAGNCQDERGPFYLLHYTGGRWRLAAHSASYGQPMQIVPDGSGGFWIPTVAGFPGNFAMLHYTGGHLRRAAMPLPGTRMTVGAVAHVPGTRVTFGGGDSYRANQQGTKTSAVILRYSS